MAHSKPYLYCLLAILIAFSSACFFSSPEDPAPGYLAIGIESQPTHLDPRYATDANSVRISGLIYNSLLRADANSQLQPELAESWEMTDQQTYRFYLRKGVRFHDGRPLTAADVKHTYDSILNPRNSSPRRAPLKVLASVDPIGPYEIRFRLSEPHAPFLEHCTIGIVPEGASATTDSKPPLGSGPFLLEAIHPGERVLLRANPNYWEGKPSVPGLSFKIVPDAIVRVLEFKKGTIQFLQNDIEPDMLPWLKRNTDGVIDMKQGTTFQYIGINLQHPILRHQKVRQALAYAIDRDAIIHHLLKDQVTSASGLLSALHWAYDGAVHVWPYDPENAKKLLDEAGYPDADGAGPNPRFKLSFKTTNLDLRRRIAEAFKEQLQRVGIELEIRTYEWGTFYGDIKKGNFHLFSLAWVGILDPDIYYNIFHSASVPPNGNNRGRYSNSEIDALVERGRRATDLGQRKIVYGQVQRILAQDLPYIPLWWWKNVIVRKPEIRGFTPYPDGDLISLKAVSYRPSHPST
ncbi:MAG: ABC transporter substrate-binding protein [Candidatus Binatia bacterium]